MNNQLIGVKMLIVLEQLNQVNKEEKSMPNKDAEEIKNSIQEFLKSHGLDPHLLEAKRVLVFFREGAMFSANAKTAAIESITFDSHKIIAGGPVLSIWCSFTRPQQDFLIKITSGTIRSDSQARLFWIEPLPG